MFDKKSAKRNICIERIDNIKLRLTEKARKAMQDSNKKKTQEVSTSQETVTGSRKK